MMFFYHNQYTDIPSFKYTYLSTYSVSHSRAPHRKEDFMVEFAIKVLDKERILSFHSLKRVSNEVMILKSLRHDYIVNLKDCIQVSQSVVLPYQCLKRVLKGYISLYC